MLILIMLISVNVNYFTMLLLVLSVILSFPSFRAEVSLQEELSSSIPEIGQNEGSDRCAHNVQSMDNFDIDYLEAIVVSQWLGLQTDETGVIGVTTGQRQVTEASTPNTTAENSTLLASDCSDVRNLGFTSSGVYRIKADPANNKEVDASVYCDFDTPGGDWLAFQRRKDGSVDFYRNWEYYSEGFGDPNGEFWLGNRLLHQITSNRSYKLRIDMEDFDNQTRFAEYSSFSVGPSSDYYRLRIGTYSHSSNAGDSLTPHNNHQFSTYDNDRDQWGSNCADHSHGSWWFSACVTSSLNGRYWRGKYSGDVNGVVWGSWRGYHDSLKKTEMKIARL